MPLPFIKQKVMVMRIFKLLPFKEFDFNSTMI